MFRISRRLYALSCQQLQYKQQVLQHAGSISSFQCRFLSTEDTIRKDFERKLALGKTLPPLEDNLMKLEMYALFKQANEGKNTTTKPGMFDFVAKAKWEAWSKLGDMSSTEAMQKYMSIIDKLANKHGVDSKGKQGSNPASTDDVLIVLNPDTGLLTIQLNRPKRHNALHRGMYRDIEQALTTSATQENVKAILFKAVGPSFSSGNDLSMFTLSGNQSIEELADQGAVLLEQFVNAFITYPKPIIAAVQGPAVGIAVTILSLCDLVYVSDAVTFHTPFTALGQSPEACSSLLFPHTMGLARANALLLLGDKMNANEAVTSGFATASFGIAEFETQVQQKVDVLLSRYPQSMQVTKALIRNANGGIKALQEANQRECQQLRKMWLSAECMDAILKFQTRKS